MKSSFLKHISASPVSCCIPVQSTSACTSFMQLRLRCHAPAAPQSQDPREGTNSKIMCSASQVPWEAPLTSFQAVWKADVRHTTTGLEIGCEAGPTCWRLLNYISLQQQQSGLGTCRELLHFSDG